LDIQIKKVFDEVYELFKNEVKNRAINFSTKFNFNNVMFKRVTESYEFKINQRNSNLNQRKTHKLCYSSIDNIKLFLDKDRIKQVLVNLVSNALKFCKFSITVECFTVDA
jgi:signal transduction histidine kinase